MEAYYLEQIRRLYEAILSNDVTTGFASVIVGFLCLAVLIRLFLRRGGLSRFEHAAPTMLTTIGVLGTFVGIFIGLLDFDVSNIDASVPQLLEGLKVAFSTSIVGMTAAVLLKLFQSIMPHSGAIPGAVTPEVIHDSLKKIDGTLERSGSQQKEALAELRRAIVGEEDASLLTQMQKLRTTVQDGQTSLIEEFRAFAQHMAENNTKALIEALKDVISDFNTQLNEQFGENFKELNSAVSALLSWQENYKSHVERLEREIEAAVKGLQTSEETLAKIAEHAERIPETMTRLESLLTALQTIVANLDAHLEGVAALRDRAIDAFPVIENNLKQLTEDLTNAVKNSVHQTTDVLDVQRQTFATMQDGYEELRVKAKEAHETFDAELNKVLHSIETELNTALEKHANIIEASATEMQREINDSWAKSEERLLAQIETLDTQMQTEVTRVLELLGRNLASLSEKFVEDYTPLTAELRRIVEMGRAV